VVALALAGVTLAVALGGRGIVCPHISRSTAINSVIGKATGYSASARLTTFGELQAADPSMGHGSSQQLGTLVWVVASNASTGDPMLREGGFIGSWPPYYNQLPDRAWFCPGYASASPMRRP